MSRRHCLRLLLQGAVATTGLTMAGALPAAANQPDSYRELLDQALTAIEQGKHNEALVPLREALERDRTETIGPLTLGALYLHTGSSTRAAQEFARVRQTSPQDILARWGEALATLSIAHTDRSAPERTALDALLPSDEENRTAPGELSENLVLLLQEYLTLIDGKASAVKNATSYVTVEEKDLLRLEIAGMAALRGGDPERGEELLRAFLDRPEMHPLVEERALLLPFLPDAPAQPGAPPLPTAIVLPEPPVGQTVAGTVALTPPVSMPDGVAFVVYEVAGGGGYTATTNNPPFTAEWNSTRYPNGPYTIHAVAYDDKGSERSASERTIRVANTAPAPSRSLTPEERSAFRQRLLALLTPRPTRKAAHFALAELASKRGETEVALRHIEAVVAIDPLYNNARESLKQYNQTVDGERTAIWRGVTNEKLVALTFDDGPHPVHTPALLDALKAAEAVATFFVVGIRAEASPTLLARMDKEGHELANHSYSHPNLTFLPRTAIERELCRTSCVIREATGEWPKFYRPPGGNANSLVSTVAETLGMAGAFWTLDGLKYEQAPFTSRQLTGYILDRIRPGAIVLLHNAPANTIAAVPEIVQGLKARGYTLVTMSELVRRSQPGSGRPTVPSPSGNLVREKQIHE